MEVIDIVAPMGELPPPAPTVEPVPRRCSVRFTGTGQEYFRIWIVNLLLTIATLGIYSAWAKVRKMQYFYRNTQLDGSVFDYHGNPVAILKGRLLAALMLVLYNVAIPLLGAYALIAVLALMVAIPWLLTQSYRFRLHNSSYRGLRFRFAGPAWQAYLIFGLPMLLALAPGVTAQTGLLGDPTHPDRRFFAVMGFFYLALTLAWPYLHFSFKRWQHGHALYGSARAHFRNTPGSFYAPYLLAVGMLIGILVAGAALALLLAVISKASPGSRAPGAAFVVWLFLFYGGLIAVVPLVAAQIQNVVWNSTRLEQVRFGSDVRAGRLIGITLTNLVMVVLSLGLLIPFAAMRVMKYKIEAIEVLDADALARFCAAAGQPRVGAAGEGAMDVMDLDFGL